MIWPFKKKTAHQPPPPLELAQLKSRAMDRPERDKILSASMGTICRETFPDNEHNQWHIRRTLHIGKTAYVMVEPEPNDAGYDLFVLLFNFRPGGPSAQDLAVYSLESPGRYDLLATAPDCPGDIPRSLIW